MFPGFTRNNAVNGGEMDAVFSPQVFTGHATLGITQTDDANYIGSKDRGRVVVSAQHWDTVATLGRHILAVVLMRANKKMRRVNAKAFVTRMANKHSLWDRAYVQFIGKAMCINKGVWRAIQHAVPVLDGVSNPQPATVTRCNVLPKPCVGIAHAATIVAWEKAGRVVLALNNQRAATSARAGRGIRGRMLLHDKPPICCATPEGVPAPLGHSLAHKYSTNVRVVEVYD